MVKGRNSGIIMAGIPAMEQCPIQRGEEVSLVALYYEIIVTALKKLGNSIFYNFGYFFEALSLFMHCVTVYHQGFSGDWYMIFGRCLKAVRTGDLLLPESNTWTA